MPNARQQPPLKILIGISLRNSVQGPESRLHLVVKKPTRIQGNQLPVSVVASCEHSRQRNVFSSSGTLHAFDFQRRRSVSPDASQKNEIVIALLKIKKGTSTYGSSKNHFVNFAPATGRVLESWFGCSILDQHIADDIRLLYSGPCPCGVYYCERITSLGGNFVGSIANDTVACDVFRHVF